MSLRLFANELTRRSFVKTTAVFCSMAGSGGMLSAAEPYPSVRTITRGPKHHWFGYYDKLQFDPTNRLVLSNEVDFEHRTPRDGDTIKVGMVDIAENDKWIELGESGAWGWQQGCMLQWRPGSADEVLWNDREGDQHVCRILNVKTRERRTISSPVYTVSPDGKFALSADFARIQNMRPGYGYVGLPDLHADELAPAGTGVSRVDLETGESTLVLSLAEIAGLTYEGEKLQNVWHYFNHLLISPNSKRFIVLHRWRARDKQSGRPTGGFTTRMLTANIDGSDVYVLDPSGRTSHFIWRDPEHVCMWTQPKGKQAAFYLFRDRSREIELVGEGVMTRNGHNTYLPISMPDWILYDTYPDLDRNQHPYLFHTPTRERFALGAFHSPSEYRGEWRCDTHPRSSNDGLLVCIDSPVANAGRQLHLIDISNIVG